MANPNAYAKQSTDNGSVDASCVFTVGAAGAVGTITRSRELLPGAAAVTHDGTGLYTFHFKEAWIACLEAGCNVIQAAFSTAGACNVDWISDAIASAGTIQLRLSKGTDRSVVDPASGDVVKAYFTLQKIDPAK